ncbi:type II toxin-antitoxin system HicA family toxin [Bacillus cytotoxicus]|uniref:type II toxin-antitoxin system HicA family toxin n=1 Tax=Bacillus cytotoxicus TaxID=580165 RepID=UPI0035CBFDC3
MYFKIIHSPKKYVQITHSLLHVLKIRVIIIIELKEVNNNSKIHKKGEKKLPSYSSKKLWKMAEEYGWIHQPKRGKGDHEIFTKPGAPYHISIPHPVKDVATGTAHKIVKQIKGF